jgi:hypothetical protein
MYIYSDKQLISQMFKQSGGLLCPECKTTMVRTAWNTAGNMLTCNTFGCTKFHTPGGWIRKDDDDHHIPFGSIGR